MISSALKLILADLLLCCVGGDSRKAHNCQAIVTKWELGKTTRGVCCAVKGRLNHPSRLRGFKKYSQQACCHRVHRHRQKETENMEKTWFSTMIPWILATLMGVCHNYGINIFCLLRLLCVFGTVCRIYPLLFCCALRNNGQAK